MSRFLFVLTVSITCSISGDALAHSVFKSSMSKSYPIMKISCNSCHVKQQKKSVRNDFGALFYKELKSEKITENWKAAKADGRDAQKAYEKEKMVPLFEAALKKIKKATVPKVEGKENPDAGKTWDEMIKAEKVSGITIDQRKKEKMEMEMKAKKDKDMEK